MLAVLEHIDRETLVISITFVVTVTIMAFYIMFS